MYQIKFQFSAGCDAVICIYKLRGKKLCPIYHNIEVLKPSQDSKEMGYAQKHIHARQLDASIHSAPLLVVLIQESKDTARPSAPVSDEHRRCVHSEAFCGQLVHVRNISRPGMFFSNRI